VTEARTDETGGAAMTAPKPEDEARDAKRSGSWPVITDVAVILAVSLAAWMATGQFAQDDLMLAYGVDPALIPRAIIILISGLALLLLVLDGALPRTAPRLHLHPRVGPVALAFGALVLYALSFERLGAFTLMPLFCAAVSRIFVRQAFWKLLAYGVLVSIGSWVLFVLLLGAPLPGSRLPFL
jgi:Tripartite tricarboxylate transporter TctB family